MYYWGMDAARRLGELVEILRRDGRVDVAAAAAEFGTAELTIRRDLDVLVERGAARRVRGGAVNLLMRGEELPFAMRAIELNGGKIAIDSELGQGTVCKVTIPIAANAPAKSAESSAA